MAFVELVKALVWPLLLGGIVWYFRGEIKRGADRVTELGPAGAKFAPLEQVPTSPVQGVSANPTTPASPTTPATPSAPRPLAQTPNLPATTGVRDFIESIRRFISDDQLNMAVLLVRSDLIAKIGQNPQDQVEALIYALASMNIQLAHEKNYNLIFGSQVALLAQMNTDAGVPPAVARSSYDNAKSAFPDLYRTYSYEQWIGFLQGSGLCTIAPNGNYVLTPLGRGFLKYILDRHLPVNKPF